MGAFVTCKGFPCSANNCKEAFSTQQDLLNHETEVHVAVHCAVSATTTPTSKEAATPEDQEQDVKTKQQESSNLVSHSTAKKEDDLTFGVADNAEHEDSSIDSIASDLSAILIESTSLPDHTKSYASYEVRSPIIMAYECLSPNSRLRTCSFMSSTMESLDGSSSSTLESDGESENYTCR